MQQAAHKRVIFLFPGQIMEITLKKFAVYMENFSVCENIKCRQCTPLGSTHKKLRNRIFTLSIITFMKWLRFFIRISSINPELCGLSALHYYSTTNNIFFYISCKHAKNVYVLLFPFFWTVLSLCALSSGCWLLRSDAHL